jgi:hypothetical protein
MMCEAESGIFCFQSAICQEHRNVLDRIETIAEPLLCHLKNRYVMGASFPLTAGVAEQSPQVTSDGGIEQTP